MCDFGNANPFWDIKLLEDNFFVCLRLYNLQWNSLNIVSFDTYFLQMRNIQKEVICLESWDFLINKLGLGSCSPILRSVFISPCNTAFLTRPFFLWGMLFTVLCFKRMWSLSYKFHSIPKMAFTIWMRNIARGGSFFP